MKILGVLLLVFCFTSFIQTDKRLDEVRGLWSGKISSKDIGSADITFNIIVGVPNKDSSVGISGRYYINDNKQAQSRFTGIVKVRKDTTASIEIKTTEKNDLFAGKFSLIKTGEKKITGKWVSDTSPATAIIELKKQ